MNTTPIKMAEEYQNPAAGQQYFSDVNTRLRGMEEKQRLLKDRTLLIGQNLVEDRESTSEDLRELKKEFLQLKQENLRMKEFLQRMSEQVSRLARKEEVMIIQRQLDMFKPHIKSQLKENKQ
jgi:hypothetical protein